MAKKKGRIMGDYLNWLLEEKNRKSCRVVGISLIILPLLYILGGGFAQGVDGHGIIFSAGWFREVFVVILSLMLFFGFILIVASFSKKK